MHLKRSVLTTLLSVLACLASAWPALAKTDGISVSRYIVRSTSVEEASAAVKRAGGFAIRELPVIDAVTVSLDSTARKILESDESILAIFEDASVALASSNANSSSKNGGDNKKPKDGGQMRLADASGPEDVPESGSSEDGGGQSVHPHASFPARIGAHGVHDLGVTGRGVTIAVLDTGLYPHANILENAEGRTRIVASYDALKDRETSTLVRIVMDTVVTLSRWPSTAPLRSRERTTASARVPIWSWSRLSMMRVLAPTPTSFEPSAG